MLRAQTGAAALAVNAQLRADETRMKQVRRGDFMERLIVMMAEEKAKLVELEAQLAEDERLKGGETGGSASSGSE